MAFVPEHAPLVVLTFLGTALFVGAAGGAFLFGWLAGRERLALLALAVAAMVATSYGEALLGLSLSSQERTLAPGEWKYFCEVDCHLAYCVDSVTTTKTLAGATARGGFVLVTLTTWFDERTTASWRPRDLALTPGGRAVALVDASGRVFGVAEEAQRALAEAGGAGTLLTRPLQPGESYTTTLVFDLPADARAPRLLLTTVGAPTHFLLGHENSFFHKKVYFQVAPPAK
jgi:hypothetical protein